MKVKLYQYFEHQKNVGDKPNEATIKHRRLQWNTNKYPPFIWHDIEYVFDERYKLEFPNKTFNIKITVFDKPLSSTSKGFPLHYYANFNWVQVWLFKRTFGIHWSQQPEWIKFYIGALLGLITGVGGGYIVWLLTHKCP